MIKCHDKNKGIIKNFEINKIIPTFPLFNNSLILFKMGPSLL
jgi:hypothetical protein